MDSSEGWEEVFCEKDEKFELVQKKRYEKNTERFVMLHKVLWCITRVLRRMDGGDIPSSLESESLAFNKYERIKIHLNRPKFSEVCELTKNIITFRALVREKIACRIFFVMSDPINSFIEVKVSDKIQFHNKRHKDCVFSVDANFVLKNHSFLYSTVMKRHKILDEIIERLRRMEICERLRTNICNDSSFLYDIDIKSFDFCDNKRLGEIPKSKEKMKRHPLYVTDSVLPPFQCIFPKRPVQGYFKGEPIYPRTNVFTLETERQIYRRGRKVISDKAYKIIGDEIRLYARWQTKDVEVFDLDGRRYMDYFHENHIPKNCIYSENGHSRYVAKILGMRFKECVVGFSYGMPIIKGIFLEQKNAQFFFNCLHVYSFRGGLEERSLEREHILKLWDKSIKRAIKYLNIKGRLE
jgi:hypothetical protein